MVKWFVQSNSNLRVKMSEMIKRVRQQAKIITKEVYFLNSFVGLLVCLFYFYSFSFLFCFPSSHQHSGVVVSALDFRSEGRWFHAQSLPSCCFRRQETSPHIFSLHPSGV